jgi:hypothetical protein
MFVLTGIPPNVQRIIGGKEDFGQNGDEYEKLFGIWEDVFA